MTAGVATGLAAGLTALAVLLARPRRRRLAVPRPGRTVPVAVAAVSLAGGLVVATALLAGGRRAVLAAAAAAVGLAVLRAARHRARRREADARRARLLVACEGLVADLRAGQPPLRALERAARAWPELAQVAVAGQVDADVPDAMRLLAATPGAGELGAVAAAWQVAHESGSGLAPALATTVESLRQRRRTARLVASEVAAARATARLLAAMPLGVLALGGALGGEPFGFLLDTVPGLACLVVGLGLTGLGWWWLERIAEGVLEP